MLTIALSGLSAEAFLYVDDIIVFGCSVQHHHNNLLKVFERLRKFNLKLNTSKCCFMKTEVIYLGHLITDKGICTDPSKHSIIENYPVPKNADDVRRFIAFCNYYRRFVKNFAQIARNLNELLKKNKPFIWSAECQESFDTLKSKLINPPILQYPNFEKPFILTTDASNFALGAVLSQGEIGSDLPISYASKTLSKHDLNKPVLEKELLAIHWAINFFRPYLYGRKFYVVTDHRPLVSLFSHKNPSSKMTRIRLDLCDYDFEISYKQGKMNTNADALSRIVVDSDTLKAMIPTEKEQESNEILAITRKMRKDMDEHGKRCDISIEKPDQLFTWECTSISDVKNLKKLRFELDSKLTEPQIIVNDVEIVVRCSDNPIDTQMSMEKLLPEMLSLHIKELALRKNDEIFKIMTIEQFKNIFNSLKRKNRECLKILIFQEPIRITDKNLQKSIITEHHNSAIGGHLGIRKTTLKIKQRYIWKNMGKMIKEHILNCKECKINKQTKHTKEKLTITDTPGNSFETVSIDTVGPLRFSNQFRYILTMQDDLTKYIIACPIESKDAKTVAKALVENLILVYGHFKILKSDKGTEFINELMAEVCKLLEIKQVFSTPYHHETLGSIERNHRVLNEFLLNFCKNDEWDYWIPYFCFAYNTTPHIDTNYTPYELIFGKLPNMPNDKILNSEPVYNMDNYANELKARLQFSLRKAKEMIEIVKKKRVDESLNINPLNLKAGDLVLVRKFNRKKNQSPYHGPYKIVKTNGVNSILDFGSIHKEFHNNNLKKY